MVLKSISKPPARAATPAARPAANWFHRLFLDPLLALLRYGATPEKLAWSLALGIAVGINPLLGSTTILGLLVMLLFRLNLAASQIANHICYPLQLLLFFPFIRLGERLFHNGRMPLHGKNLLHQARIHPIQTTRLLWTWEWHALIVWFLVALVLAPAIAYSVMPLLRAAAARLHPNGAPTKA